MLGEPVEGGFFGVGPGGGGGLVAVAGAGDEVDFGVGAGGFEGGGEALILLDGDGGVVGALDEAVRPCGRK